MMSLNIAYINRRLLNLGHTSTLAVRTFSLKKIVSDKKSSVVVTFIKSIYSPFYRP